MPRTVKHAKIPQPLSAGEEEFSLQCRIYNLCPVREYEFYPGRKYRFDFAFPDIKLAVEVDGGTLFGKSRHSRGEGYERDCAKMNSAAMMGWRVLRYSTTMVRRGEAIRDVLNALDELGKGRGK